MENNSKVKQNKSNNKQNDKPLYEVFPNAKSYVSFQAVFVIIIAFLCIAGDCFFVGVSIMYGITAKFKFWITCIFAMLLIIHVVPEIAWLTHVFEKRTDLENTKYTVYADRVEISWGKTQLHSEKRSVLYYRDVTSVKLKAFGAGENSNNIVIKIDGELYKIYSIDKETAKKIFELIIGVKDQKVKEA